MIRHVPTFYLQIQAKWAYGGQPGPTQVSVLRSVIMACSGRAKREGGRPVGWGGRATETASLSLGISLRSISFTRPSWHGPARGNDELVRTPPRAARSVSRSVDSSMELRETPGPPAPLQTQAMGRSGGHDYPPPTCSWKGWGRVVVSTSLLLVEWGRGRAGMRCLDGVSARVLA
jgi:hypothetical protein